MPNWCSNYINAIFEDSSLIDAFLARLTDASGNLDFEALIPKPRILDSIRTGLRVIDGEEATIWMEEDGVSRVLSPSEVEEYKQVGFKSWYEWSVANWGTKWNASETSVNLEEREWGTIEITFETAWSPPYQIFARLLESYPNVEFEFRCRLEDDHPYPHEILASDLPDAIRRTRRLLML